MNRRQYLLHCVSISLKRRAMWVLAAAVAALMVAVALNLTLAWTVFFTVLGALITAAGIGMNSWTRHSSDPEARPKEVIPQQSIQ